MDEVKRDLRAEQEVLLKLSQALIDSSQETVLNVDEVDEQLKFEDFIVEENISKNMYSKNDGFAEKNNARGMISKSVTETTYQKKGTTNSEINKNAYESQIEYIKNETCSDTRDDHDSGLGTPNEILSAIKSEVGGEFQNLYECGVGAVFEKLTDLNDPDSQDSVASEESVSLLEDAILPRYNLRREKRTTTATPSHRVKVMSPFSGDGPRKREVSSLVTDKSTQTVTVLAPSPADYTTARDVVFLSSIFKLKRIFSAGTNKQTSNYAGLFRNALGLLYHSQEGNTVAEASNTEIIEVKIKNNENMIGPRNAYFIKAVNVEVVVEKSVESLLHWLREQTKDWKMLCEFWNSSLRADAIAVINDAVNSNVCSIRKKVSIFLREVLDEIYHAEFFVEDSVQEYKTAFLSAFCISPFLICDMIMYIEQKLEDAKLRIKNYKIKIQIVTSVKATYFCLRLLEDLLRLFLSHLNGDSSDDVIQEECLSNRGSVLEMWKNNWKKFCETGYCDCRREYLGTINEWYVRTEAMLKFSVDEAPLLSSITQKCSSLTLELLSKLQYKQAF